MTSRTHDAFAFASLVTTAVLFPPAALSIGTLSASIVGNIVGSMVPDMDQASNRLWDLLPAGDYLGKLFRKVFISHRSLSHSIIGVFLIYKIIGWVFPRLLNPLFIDTKVVFISFMIGYISHLVADSLTKEGLPLFFPFRFNFGFPPFSFLRITTGSWVENFIVLPSVAVYLFFVASVFKVELVQILSLVTK